MLRVHSCRSQGDSMHKLMTVCLVVSVSIAISCSRKPSDESISQDIQKKAAVDPQAQEAQVTVECNHGKVTLKGKAKTEVVRHEVETIAKEEPGVTSVEDEVVIDESVVANPVPVAAPMVLAAERAPLPPPPPPPVVVPAGTVLTIRLGQALGSETRQVGTPFTGSVATPISIDGKMVIPAGSDITGTVREAKKAGRFKGAAVLSLQVDSIVVNGHQYNVE